MKEPQQRGLHLSRASEGVTESAKDHLQSTITSTQVENHYSDVRKLPGLSLSLRNLCGHVNRPRVKETSRRLSLRSEPVHLELWAKGPAVVGGGNDGSVCAVPPTGVTSTPTLGSHPEVSKRSLEMEDWRRSVSPSSPLVDRSPGKESCHVKDRVETFWYVGSWFEGWSLSLQEAIVFRNEGDRHWNVCQQVSTIYSSQLV